MKVIDKIAEAVAQVVQRLPEITAFEVSAMHKQRVFNRGEGSQGERLNYKSEYWKDRRKAKGRQVDYVDFEFEGTLRRSLKVGLDDKDQTAYGVDTSQNTNISNQKLLNAINDRFDNFMAVSDEEIKKAEETAQRYATETIIKAINEIR